MISFWNFEFFPKQIVVSFEQRREGEAKLSCSNTTSTANVLAQSWVSVNTDANHTSKFDQNFHKSNKESIEANNTQYEKGMSGLRK